MNPKNVFSDFAMTMPSTVVWNMNHLFHITFTQIKMNCEHKVSGKKKQLSIDWIFVIITQALDDILITLNENQ